MKQSKFPTNLPVLNLWHIKRPNGMYYYGLDYAKKVGIPWEVFVRPDFPTELFSAEPGWRVRRLSGWAYLWLVTLAAIRGRFIYCPSPHPIPGISRQLVVVHDSYPFRSGIGSLKRALCYLSLNMSRCAVGYINHADALNFLHQLGVSGQRLHYMPNAVPPAPPRTRRREPGFFSGKIRIGLIGTDSPKKNYAALFAAVTQLGMTSKIDFHMYGLNTPYLRDLQRQYSDLKIMLMESTETDLSDFFEGIDAVVSVAKGEGFSRPIASALVRGLRCVLLDDPIFREFYDGHAIFGNSLIEVLNLLTNEIGADQNQSGMCKYQLPHFPPFELVQAFEIGSGFLKKLIEIGNER